MPEDADNVIFERVTGCIRKPVVRFRLASGRQVEPLAFHLEPAWAFNYETPRPIVAEVVRRLYPGERAVVVPPPPAQGSGPAFLCVAHLYSDAPAGRPEGVANHSSLVVCGLVDRID